MIKVGVTGGIGAGKTLVCRVFNLLGIPLYNADYYAKHLMQSNENLIKAIKQSFGEHIYNNNKLNRKALAEIVFNNQEKLNQLNKIVHPAVFEHARQWFVQQQQQNKPYAIKEAALLFETDSYKALDMTILVTAPQTVKINRIIKRDQTNADSIKSRMNKQWSDDQKKELAQFCIYNDDVQAIIPQINDIHRQIISAA